VPRLSEGAGLKTPSPAAAWTSGHHGQVYDTLALTEDNELTLALKTLGASSRLIATTLMVEYGVLGAIAGTVGALGAVALSWAVARFALDLPWEPSPALTLGGIVVTSIFVAAIGVLASLDVLRHKPLATLRAE